jgi:hypothetical protein
MRIRYFIEYKRPDPNKWEFIPIGVWAHGVNDRSAFEVGYVPGFDAEEWDAGLEAQADGRPPALAEGRGRGEVAHARHDDGRHEAQYTRHHGEWWAHAYRQIQG